MRVLLGVHAFPPRATAGVEVYSLRLARGLIDLGHDVLVLSAVHDLAAEPGAVRRRVHEGVPVAEIVNLHQRGTLEATYDDPDVDRAARAIFAEFRPEVVHLQHLLNLSIGVIAAARTHAAPVLLTLHDYWLSCPRDGQRMRADQVLCATMDHGTCGRCLADSPYLVPPLQRGLVGLARRAGAGRALHRLHDLLPGPTNAALRLVRRSAAPAVGLDRAMDRRAERLRSALAGVARVLAPTHFARERALEFGLPSEAVSVLTLGAVGGPALPRSPGPRPRLGFIGTLAPHKGVHVLLEAFSRLDDTLASLDLFGSTTVEPGYVEDLRRRHAADPRIRFRGAFPEGEQARVLREIDALVVPSLWWENSPLTALEALRAGRPVIASRTGGVPEIVAHEQTGLLVPPGDPLALAAALGDVVAGRRLGEAAPPALLKTVEQGARELAALYADLIDASKTAAPRVHAKAPRATVVVPVLDGGAHLPALLGSLRAQDLDLEILAIDSGSSDDSVPILSAAGVRLLQIQPLAFDHGETRNLGAREAQGAFVIFLSQDALPTDSGFASRLVAALEQDDRLAGAFARQVPRPDADALTRRDLASWVAAAPQGRSVFLPERSLTQLPPLERYRLAAFDNVASAVRRSVLLAHPFAPARFGEDIEWGTRVLQLGYGIAYVSEAVVAHSHRRSARALYRRNYLGHRALFRLFGLQTIPDAAHLARAVLGSIVSDLRTLASARSRPSEWWGAPGQALAACWGQYRGARDERRARPYPEWT